MITIAPWRCPCQPTVSFPNSGSCALWAKNTDCREDTVSGGWGEVRCGQREWEDFYRRRWQYDKRVRSTHGVNCTGSCSWDVYVKNGIIVWETQRTDYPGCGAGFPNHEPRGCPRGATYSWYTYSPVRLKHPLMRSTLLALWREALAAQPDPVAAWRSIVADEAKRTVLPDRTRQGRLRPGVLGRGGNPRGRFPHPHHPDPRPRPHLRLHADPGHVHGLLRLRGALSVAHRRGAGELLRLVLRPAAGLAPDVGRADRRSRKRRLVRVLLHDRLGHQPAHDAHAGRPLLHRGPLPRRAGGGRGPGLRRVRQVRGHLAAGQGRHGRGARHGHEPRHPQGVLHRPAERVFHVLCQGLHRSAVRGRAGSARGGFQGRPLPAGRGPGPHVEQRPVEDRSLRRRLRRLRGAERQHRLPLERGGPLEPESEGLGHGRRHRPIAQLRVILRALGPGALPAFRRERRRHARRRRAGQTGANPGRAGRRHDGLRPSGRPSRRPAQGDGCAPGGLPLRIQRPAGLHARLAGGHHRCPGRGRDPRGPRVRGECGKDPGQVHDLPRRRHQPLVPQRHDLPGHPQPHHALRLPGGQRRRLGALRGPGKGAAPVGLVPGGLRTGLAPAAAPAERDLALVLRDRPVALRHPGPADAGFAAGAIPGAAAPGGLQRDRRPARVAAVVPAVRPQPDRPGPRGRGGRRGLGCGDRRPRGGAAEEGRGALRRRRPRPPGQLPAGALPLAREPARRELQGPRVFPETPARGGQRGAEHRKPRSGRRRSCGASAPRKASSTCW